MSMYGLLPQIFFTEQGTEYESYSLTVGTEVIQDVLPDRELMKKLLQLLQRYNPSRAHLMEIIQDFRAEYLGI